MAIGASLRAIKPFGSFKIKVWPYKLQGLSNPKEKSLLIFNPCNYLDAPKYLLICMAIGASLRAIKPFSIFEQIGRASCRERV